MQRKYHFNKNIIFIIKRCYKFHGTYIILIHLKMFLQLLHKRVISFKHCWPVVCKECVKIHHDLHSEITYTHTHTPTQMQIAELCGTFNSLYNYHYLFHSMIIQFCRCLSERVFLLCSVKFFNHNFASGVKLAQRFLLKLIMKEGCRVVYVVLILEHT